MNYKITKIGLLNFWYFDEEEFHFRDGKLLLRGENGSGKSVTMQSFIPLILDGNKTPKRLDPFGSKEKKIEDYLLGPSDGVRKDEAYSYLYMETYNEQLDKYITIGIGFHAKKGKPTDFWGFALKDGRRIKEDFFLYKDHVQKVLLTKNELKARLGVENEFCEKAYEYKKMVNNLLFGFNDIDSYDEFINVLLQLRSSKLSRDYNPTKLMEILTSVLQPLTDDDLRPLSEAIEDTNKTKEKIEMLNRQIKAINNFLITYQNYNEILLYNKAYDYKEAQKNIKNQKNIIDKQEKEMKIIKSRLTEIKTEFINLDNEYNEYLTKKDAIDNNDIKEHTKNLELVNNEINEVKANLDIIKEKLINLDNKNKKNNIELNKIENDLYQYQKELNITLGNVKTLSEEVNLTEVTLAISKFVEDNIIDFEYLFTRINKYKNKLSEIKQNLDEKENLEIELNKKEEEYLKIKKDYRKKEEKLSDLEDDKLKIIDSVKDKINLLNKQNKYLKLEDDIRSKIFNLINNYNSGNYYEAYNLYQKVGIYYQNKFMEEKYNLNNKLTVAKEELSILEKDLKLLENSEEIVLEDDINIENKLEELEINYISFYKAIEFKEEISIIDRNKLEELLLSLNILNAKIVSSKDIKKIENIGGKFLIASTVKKNNLTKYFKVVDNDKISNNDIKAILESISVDKENYINNKEYKLDFILGRPTNEYEAKYIGILKRMEEHQKKVNIKKEEIEVKKSIISNYLNLIININDKLEVLKTETNNFVDNFELESISNTITNIEIELDYIVKNDKKLSEQIVLINNKIELILKKINEIKENINISLNTAKYKEAIANVEVLQKELYELKVNYNSYKNLEDRKISYEVLKEEINNDIEYQNNEFSSKNNNFNKLMAKKSAIEDVLSNPIYQDLIEQMKKITKKLSEIPIHQNELSKEEGKLENSYLNLEIEVSNNKTELIKTQALLEIKESIFIKEYNLHYVYKEEDYDIDKILKDLDNRRNSDVMRALTNYISSLNEYRNDLIEYRLNTKEINSEYKLDNEKLKLFNETEINLILTKAIRQDVNAIYQGKIVNIYQLSASIEEAKQESQNYINTQERHLFEDILLKTIGTKIRDRIESSKAWVKKMNDIMKETQIGSNLSFQLEWKNKEAYTEEELDTKELVRLFQIDAGLINQTDSNNLINHFRSKIKQELEFSLDNDSYANIIARVLDYRNWFEFKLYYKRKVGEKKELTNRVFSTLSGGERAKSMYVPLFAAVYAKLLSANNNALRIIALDEAFAGVDDTNITEMFSILSQLNLDYILTSQVLWGDYSTIEDLAICELIKDEELSSVAIRNYRWNGVIKQLLD